MMLKRSAPDSTVPWTPPGKNRWLLLLFLLFSLFFLSGCVRYEVGVEIQGQYQGQIRQHIRLGETLTNFSQQEAQQWLASIERRAKQLHGKVQHLGPADVQVTIPFGNGQELGDRFNQFFNPNEQPAPSSSQPTPPQPTTDNLVELTANLGLSQSNLLLLERDHLHLDVDLRGLGTLGSQQPFLLNAQEVLNLEFALQTPWGATLTERNQIPAQQRGNQLVWHLQPGQLNHLEARFWLPSNLGLGTLAIIGLSVGGAILKNYLGQE
ncbi:MAG: DUF3153 domain-containing protein [Cyanobacteria bacterium P01_G01_bin.54]